MTSDYQQWLRKCGLFITGGGQALDLSSMRIKFKIENADSDRPNTSTIDIYNLKDETANRIGTEFTGVTLQAGYETGNFGVIFQGGIKQVEKGRYDAKDSFVRIYAGDGDQAYIYSVVNKSLAAGSSRQDQAAAIGEATTPNGVAMGDTSALAATPTGGVLPRGKVLFGLARTKMDDITNTAGCSWSIQNGKIVIIPLTGYLPGEAVVLNSRTGMIGVPEATDNGITVDCLLNPFIKIGTRVQIDQKLINRTTILQQGFPRYSDINYIASVTDDGYYRVLVAEHEGDTRGNPWYTHLTCLAIDQSAAPAQSVKAYG